MILLHKGYIKVGRGCNATLIGTGVVPFLRDLSNNQLATLPESFGDLKVGGAL